MKFTKITTNMYMGGLFDISPIDYITNEIITFTKYAIILFQKRNHVTNKLYKIFNTNEFRFSEKQYYDYYFGNKGFSDDMGNLCGYENLVFDLSSNDKNNDIAYMYEIKASLMYDTDGIIKPCREEESISISNVYDIFFFYQNQIYYYNNINEHLENEQLLLLFKKYAYKQNKKFNILRKEIEIFENMDLNTNDKRNREPIPEEVRFTVWRRDGGKCVNCGSNFNLEFDHIIPFSKGGGNTERNLQLLCEFCNRKKSNKI